jgi:hypothetical protein
VGRPLPMPPLLVGFLDGLSDADADALWAWLDGTPGAIQRIIKVLVDHHPLLVEERYGD